MWSQLKIMHLLWKVGMHAVGSGNLSFSLYGWLVSWFLASASVISLRRLLSELDFLWGLLSHPAINYFFIVNTLFKKQNNPGIVT